MAKKSAKKIKSYKTAHAKKDVKTALSAVRAADCLLLIILAALVYLIISGPFQRGLFFPEELLPAHIISFCLFILWWISKLLRKDGAFLKTPLDYCVFALVFFYFLSFFVAVNKYAAQGEFLKVANYLVIYMLVFDICRRNPLSLFKKSTGGKQKVEEAESFTGLNLILHILLAAGFAVALGGLGTAAGTWEIHGAYVGGRIHTPLQYPNTAAAYLTASYFIALGLMSAVRKRYFRPLYLIPAGIIFITFIFTYSRGAWLLMPFLALLFLLVIGGGNRLRMGIYLFLSVLVTLLFMARIENALRGDDPLLTWKYILLAVFLMLAGGFLTEIFLALHWKLKCAFMGILAVLLVFMAAQAVLPELGRPLRLGGEADEASGRRYLEQRVSNIAPHESCLLSLEVSAARELNMEVEKEPDYVWRLLVYGYDLDDQRTTVLDHREGSTSGWEAREFALLPEGNIQRMEIRLYNNAGTTVSARNIFFKDSRGERALNFTLHRILPDRIYQRIHAIGAGERSVEGRFTFYGDAFKIIKDYPLLGAGGGGWKSLYLGYQQQRYFTTEVHNHFLQVWIEAGTPGFLAFLGIWFFFIRSFVRGFFNGRTSLEEKKYRVAVFIPALALGAHSAIDFNLSLGAVSIFLFALLGAGRSLDREEGYFTLRWGKKYKFPGMPWSSSFVGIIAGIFLLSFAISLWSGHRLGVEAEKQARENNLEEALELFAEAIKKDPYQPTNYINLGRIYDRLASIEENREAASQLREKALDLTRRALALEFYNPAYNLDYGAILLRYGYVEEGVYYIKRLIELHPHQGDSFVQAARAQLAVAEHYLELKNEEKTNRHLQEVLLLKDKMEEVYGSSEALNFYLGKAAYLLGDDVQAEAFFAQISEKDSNYDESRVYLAVLCERKGNEEKAGDLKKIFADNQELMELYRQMAL